MYFCLPCFSVTCEEGFNKRSDETEEFIDVIDLQKPLSSPSVEAPPAWLCSVRIPPVLEPVVVNSLLQH